MKQMDQQLKERLVGAAVLVILGILLIPSLLNGPPDDAPVRVGVELPAAEREGKPSQTIRIDVASEEPGAGSIKRTAETPPDLRPEPATGARPEPHRSSPPKPEPAVVREEAGKVTPPETAGTGSSPDSPAVAPKPAAVGEEWAVQVGSFSNKENAGRLARDLEKLGYDVFIDRATSGGKTWHRVRIGPVASKSDAEALAGRLKAAGQTGTVVPVGG